MLDPTLHLTFKSHAQGYFAVQDPEALRVFLTFALKDFFQVTKRRN